jgi:hypothetical protein
MSLRPAPRSVAVPIYTPDEQARALRTLLGGRIAGVWQLDGEGTYRGALSAFSDEDARAHYAGERTFAIAAVTDPEPRGRRRHAAQRVFPKTHLLAFDVDERFAQRLPLLARELQARCFEAAAIATSGSDAGRGKVFVFFRNAYDARRVRNLGKKILDAARLDATWGIEAKPVEVYPLGGTGGLLRIGGRNRKADRHALGCDVFFDLDGQPKALAQVQPAQRIRFPVDPIAIPVAPVQPWVAQALTYGLAYALPVEYAQAKRNERPLVGNTAVINKFVYRLAHEAIRRECGQGESYAKACNVFQGWLERISAASDGRLDEPSPMNHDKRNPLEWDRCGASAWSAAVAVDRAARERADTIASGGAVTLSAPRGAEPLDNVTPAKRADFSDESLTKNERAVLPTLYDYARKKGITPDCFGISYREIATYAGLSDPQLAHRAVKNLVRKGYVVIHDRGTRGKRGLPTILGLVSETPARVTSPVPSSVPEAEGRRRLIDSEASRRCAAIAETRPNLRARRQRIEQFQNGTWKVEPQREDESVNATNVVDFGAKLAARRPNAPTLQQTLLDVNESATPVAATSNARPSRSPKNQFSGAATLFENSEAQAAAPPVQTAAPQAHETPSSADAGSRKSQARVTEKAQSESPSPASSPDAALAQIALRGHGLSAVERDALLAQLARAVFDDLHADAETAAAVTHGFLRAVPDRFEAFVRAKMVEIIMHRHAGARPA